MGCRWASNSNWVGQKRVWVSMRGGSVKARKQDRMECSWASNSSCAGRSGVWVRVGGVG